MDLVTNILYWKQNTSKGDKTIKTIKENVTIFREEFGPLKLVLPLKPCNVCLNFIKWSMDDWLCYKHGSLKMLENQKLFSLFKCIINFDYCMTMQF